jgi:broad specificity phosphatase PhoE
VNKLVRPSKTTVVGKGSRLSPGMRTKDYHACYERPVLRACFIRHGKATSVLSGADYDALSPLGVEQSELLGAWLAAHSPPLDAVLIGPRKRHAETYAAAARASTAAGRPLPPPTVVAELDEHDAVTMIGRLLPVLVAEDPAVRALVVAATKGEPPPEDDIIAAFRGVARRWVAGELPQGDVEPWSEFRARVVRGLDAVSSAAAPEPPAAPRTVLVFTSAGVIATALGVALGLSDEKTIDLSVVPHNASLTDMDWSPAGWALRSFNATPHLFETRLITRI